jgi:hypothetical protein
VKVGRRGAGGGGQVQTLNIPLGRVLQAAIGTVVDGFAKAFGHFSVYRHDGRSHDRCKRQTTIRKVGPRFVATR